MTPALPPSPPPRLLIIVVTLVSVAAVAEAVEAAAAANATPAWRSVPPRRSLPLFRAPTDAEASAATAASAPLVWSAHQTQDTLIVVSDAQPMALACLLDHSGGGEDLELSWTVEDATRTQVTRHTLTASGTSSGARQTFSVDLGPGLPPASGVFDPHSGSILSVTLASHLSSLLGVGCDLRLAGAVAVRSARLRLWDERAATAALTATQADGLECQLKRRRPPLTSTFDSATLDCAGPRTIVDLTLLETAVLCVHATPPSRDCSEFSQPRLQSNVTDPGGFFAVYQAGSRFHFGWAVQGVGAELQNRLDAGLPAGGGGELCVTAEVALPSGSGRSLRLSWRARVALRNSSVGVAVAVADSSSWSFNVSIDPFKDPPIGRALPCPYLCPPTAAPAADAACKYVWLHAPPSSAAFGPPDQSLGLLTRPHSLLLLPWQPPDNPVPPPLSGRWTCLSQAAVFAIDQRQPQTPVFHVNIAARPSICGVRAPRRSVVFVSGNSTQLSINCTLCGVDSSVDARLDTAGSVGGVEADVVRASSQMRGGVVELRLTLSRIRLTSPPIVQDGAPAAILVRCSALDRRGRGSVAYSAVEALPAPRSNSAPLDADCDGDSGCLFRCPLDPLLASHVRRNSLEAAFLFTLHPASGAPPQQVLAAADQFRSAERVSRLRCAQLILYADSDGARSQGGPVSPDAGTDGTVYRSALGDFRYLRLILAVQSTWLTPPRRQQVYVPNSHSPTAAYDTVDILVGILIFIGFLIAIVCLCDVLRDKCFCAAFCRRVVDLVRFWRDSQKRGAPSTKGPEAGGAAGDAADGAVGKSPSPPLQESTGIDATDDKAQQPPGWKAKMKLLRQEGRRRDEDSSDEEGSLDGSKSRMKRISSKMLAKQRRGRRPSGGEHARFGASHDMAACADVALRPSTLSRFSRTMHICPLSSSTVATACIESTIPTRHPLFVAHVAESDEPPDYEEAVVVVASAVEPALLILHPLDTGCRVQETARMAGCQTCHPTTTITSSSSASVAQNPGATPEVDLSCSDDVQHLLLRPAQPTPKLTAPSADSTNDYSLSGGDEEDMGVTGTGCCSSESSPVTIALVAEVFISSESEDTEKILQAEVRRAVMRSMNED